MIRKLSFGARTHNLGEVERAVEHSFEIAEIDWKDPAQIRNDWDALRALQKRHNMTFLAHGPNEKDRFDADEITEHMAPRICRLLDLASGMGIHTYTQHLCLDGRSLNEETVRRKIDVLELWSRYATERGIAFCLENLSEHAHHFAPAFERIPELHMTLDVGHAELLTETNTSMGFIENHPDRIHHVHLHDNRGGSSSKSDLHLPIGEGSIDIFGILKKLLASGYEGILSFEVQLARMDECRDAVLEMMGHILSGQDHLGGSK
jgi:sugar phosphate isomerase/epimerase